MKPTVMIPAAVTSTKPWMNSFGKLRGLSKETARINRLIEEEFGKVEPADLPRYSTQMLAPISLTAT